MSTFRIGVRAPALALLALLAGGAPARADTTVATTARPTALAAGFGVLLYSAWDDTAQAYRLTEHTLRTGVTRALPVAPSTRPFDADIGRTHSRRAFYVYSRCGVAPGSCDLYAFNPTTGVEQRSQASDPEHDDRLPTYWSGRLAFVREYGTEQRPRQVVYQRPTAQTGRSERLPGVPRRRCDRGACLDSRARFTALELHGRQRLAQIVRSDDVQTFRTAGRPTESFRVEGVELRLVDRGLTRSRRLLRSGTGIGGQSLSGLSFTSQGLDVSFSCLADPGGCTRLRPGIYRYGYSFRERFVSWAFAADASPIYGLASVNSRIYELRDGSGAVAGPAGRLECDQVDVGPPNAPRCAIVRRDPTPSFVPIPAP